MEAAGPATPRFAVLTNFDDQYEVGYLCSAVNELYCARWGHEFLPFVLTKDEMSQVCEGRHFAWAKIALFAWLLSDREGASPAGRVFRSWLGEGGRERLLESVDYLVWIDGDAMVLDHSVPLQQFVQGDARGKAMVLAEDMSWADYLNTGCFFVQVKSAWVKDLWSEVWDGSHPRFHHAPFWDQSGFCQALARRGEFVPDVLGAQPTGLRPSIEPWFSWQGGPFKKATKHLHILDSASLQFANPLHAHFVLHLCGFSSKLELCRATVESGRLRGVDRDEASLHCGSFTRKHVASRLSGPLWEAAARSIREGIGASNASSWGWPCYPRACKRLDLFPETSSRTVEQWQLASRAEEPTIVKAAAPAVWSLGNLREVCGGEKVMIDDGTPLRADDALPPGPPQSRSLTVLLWHFRDYVRGIPPPCHPVLGRLDPRRQWRVARWQPWARGGGGGGAVGTEFGIPSPWGALSADLQQVWNCAGEFGRELNADLAKHSVVHAFPPAARLRLHRPSRSQSLHWAIWQLEGAFEFKLWPPECSRAFAGEAGRGPLFCAWQSSLDPWQQEGPSPQRTLVLHAGEMLLLPTGWWIAGVALSPTLAIWRPWVSAGRIKEYVVEKQQMHAEVESFRRRASPAGGSPLAKDLQDSGDVWRKQVLRKGARIVPSHEVAFNAVAHIEEFSPDGGGVRSTRLGLEAAPEVVHIRPGRPGPGASHWLDEALRSMAVGELALIAAKRGTPGGAGGAAVCVFLVELLDVVLPTSAGPAAAEALDVGGWFWFGDPSNWLGAPPGHEPVDQMQEARRKEEQQLRKQAASRRGATQGAASSRAHRLHAFETTATCVRQCWRQVPRRKLYHIVG